MGKNKIILLFNNNLGYNGSYHGYCCCGSIELSGNSLFDDDNFHHTPNIQLNNRARELDDSKKLINKSFFLFKINNPDWLNSKCLTKKYTIVLIVEV